jgi:hypothetical protein
MKLIAFSLAAILCLVAPAANAQRYPKPPVPLAPPYRPPPPIVVISPAPIYTPPPRIVAPPVLVIPPAPPKAEPPRADWGCTDTRDAEGKLVRRCPESSTW